MEKKKTILIIILVVLVCLLGIETFYVIKNKKTDTTETTTTNTTKNSDTVTGTKIDLSSYTEDVSITSGGEYTLSGTLAYSVVINTSEDVTLNLNGVVIHATDKAGIANIGTGTLTIHLVADTTNTITDGGSSDYDGAIYSASNLIFNGTGSLTVKGNQEEGEGIATTAANITFNGGTYHIESADDGINAGGDGGTITFNGGTFYIKANGDGIDSNKNAIINGGTIFVMGSSQGGDAGIDTDQGYVINGGTVIALGSDMLEVPQSSSTQNTLCLTLDSSIASGTNLTLVDSNDKEVLAFQADDNFKTLVISSSTLSNGTYKLYQGTTNTGSLSNNIYTNDSYSGGTLVSVNHTTLFTISSVVTSYGSTMNQGGPNGGMTPPNN